jgi:hypothetical protein
MAVGDIIEIPQLNHVQGTTFALVYSPGAGNAWYSQHTQAWNDLGLMGCTGLLKQFVEAMATFAENNIVARSISTMSAADEQSAQSDQANPKRPFTTPANTDAFAIVTDSGKDYKAYYGEDLITVAPTKEVYFFRAVIFEKQGDGKFKCISVLDGKDNITPDKIIEAVQAHRKPVATAAAAAQRTGTAHMSLAAAAVAFGTSSQDAKRGNDAAGPAAKRPCTNSGGQS